MKKILTLIVLLALTLTTSAQTARQVLDKAAAVVSQKGGVKASFKMASTQYGNASGTISLKGRKFQLSVPQAKMWFDGKTLWTYMTNNDEVNVSNPTDAQLQVLNPYQFINMYKQGYNYTLKTAGTTHQVHLTAKDQKRRVQEMYITVNKKTCSPTQIKMKQGDKWTTFTVVSLKSAKLADANFRFNAKDYPKAEVIDLR